MVTVATTSFIWRRDRVDRLNAQYEGMAPEQVIRHACSVEFPGRLGVVSSFGAESVVLLHLVASADRALPVVFLDTGKHFPETIAYRDLIVDRLGLTNVVVTTPRPEQLQTSDPEGRLHATDPDLCCHVRKTLPMISALQPFDCYFTGRKRYQGESRAALNCVELQDRWFKINPLASVGRGYMRAYMSEHHLPAHPLVARGYPSIGCQPCTASVAAGEPERAGRWANSEKTECGIHFSDSGKLLRSGSQ